MSAFWTSIAEGMARRRLTGLIAASMVMLVWIYFNDISPRVKTEKTTATVVEVGEKSWHLELDTGEPVWIFAVPGITVRRGDTVPVLIGTYESGKRRVVFDEEKWMFGG